VNVNVDLIWFTSLDMKRSTVLVLMALFSTVATSHGRVLEGTAECPLPRTSIPVCPFPDPEFSLFFPHPTDCHWFFHCSNGQAYCKQCPADLHWNTQLQTCDYAYRAGCSRKEYSSALSANKPTQRPTSLTTTSAATSPATTDPSVSAESTTKCPVGPVPKCEYPDRKYSLFFPHPTDCHWFFHCSNGVAYCKKCPAELHWNVKLQTCDYVYRAGCRENGRFQTINK
jgi:hypothetical protein